MSIDNTSKPYLVDGHSDNGTKAFFYDSEELWQAGQAFPDSSVAVLLASPTLSVIRYRPQPGEHLDPHRHGCHQITFMLDGELQYGNRVTRRGTGYYTPNRKYSWRAGPEGADFIEIHAGEPQPPIYD